MKNSTKFIWLVVLSILTFFIAVGVGSVYVSPASIWHVLLYKLFSVPLPNTIAPTIVSIIWDVRIPRVLVGFLVGAALSVSGTVMQSVLQNPLASSYTLGVSSGAALGAFIVITTGISFAGVFTLPLMGFLFGFGTIILVIFLARAMDKTLDNQTVILIGMVLSLFFNAILTFITALNRDGVQRLILWQMGSLVDRKWTHVAILLPIVVLCILILLRYLREMDIMTFGDSRSQAIGVNVPVVKWILLIVSSILTGAAVCFTGVIGFIDLISPHLMRRIFGSSHRVTLPASALFGGVFLVLSDLIARTILSPVELSVGAITAFIGAPFFAYVFFKTRKKV